MASNCHVQFLGILDATRSVSQSISEILSQQRARCRMSDAAKVDVANYPIFLLAEQNWDAHKSDCSGYVRAVAADLGIPLHGFANQLVDYWSRSPSWVTLGNDAARASELAAQGYFVVAGKKEKEGHGHVVIIVPGRSSQGDAMGYWGTLGRIGHKNTGICLEEGRPPGRSIFRPGCTPTEG
jgi:cell wall-associated NlpC family hydrolase